MKCLAARFAASAKAVILATAISAAAANASWQNTRWGMTLEELESESRDPLLTEHDFSWTASDKSEVRAARKYRSRNFAFVAFFGFDHRGGLNRVTLHLLDPTRCLRLLDDLEGVYGTPDAQTGTGSRNASVTRWRDEDNGNRIALIAIGPLRDPVRCQLDYEPVESIEESGL